MENFNHLSTKKHMLTYGLIGGLIGVAFGVILYVQGMHYDRSWQIQTIQFLISAAVIVFAIIQFKKDNQGFLKLGQAIKLGAGVALLIGLIGTLWFVVMSNLLEPDFMDKMMDLAKEEAFANNPQMTDEMWEQGAAMQKKFMPVFLIFGLLVSALFGLIVGLITGLIAKKEPGL